MELNLEKFNKLPSRKDSKALVALVQKAIDSCTSRDDRMEIDVNIFPRDAINEVKELLEDNGFCFYYYNGPMWNFNSTIVFYMKS